jgi:phage terminase small subunit
MRQKEKRLTPKQTMFVSGFLIDGNATAAAKRAGYSERTAEKIGSENLRKPEIAKAIASKQAMRLERNEVSADRIIAQLAAIAFADPRKLFHDDGAMKPLSELDDDMRAALVVEVTQGFDQDGNPIQTRKTKLACKLIALDKLCRNLGLFQDKLKISGDSDNPLLLLIKRINIQHSAIQPVIEGRVEDYDQAA